MMGEWDSQRAADETWQALLSAGVFTEGDFEFASGQRATLKADAEALYSHDEERAVLLGHFALHPAVQQADTLTYVPMGMRQFMHELGELTEKPVINTQKVPGAPRYTFSFVSPGDAAIAHDAETVLIGEDVATTLGSVAGVRGLFLPTQRVLSLAILKRSEVDPANRVGLEDHYLLERDIPTDAAAFHQSLRD